MLTASDFISEFGKDLKKLGLTIEGQICCILDASAHADMYRPRHQPLHLACYQVAPLQE